MKLDILLATYNGDAHLEELLTSLSKQTKQDFGLLIRDDGSNDRTPQIAANAGQLLPSETNVGVVENFSRLLAASEADYVMFCDQDDVWLPTKVQNTLKKMGQLEKEHGKKKPLLVHTDLAVVGPDLKPISSSFFAYNNLKPSASLSHILAQNRVTGCTALLNRALVDLVFPIPREAIMHDWWVALTAATFGKIGYLPEATLLYRQHGNNTLGAQKFYSLKNIIQGLKRIKSPDKYHQAEAFLHHHKERLTDDQQNLLQIFSQLPKMPYFKRRYLILKHRFFKSGFLRNFAQFLFV